jgi:hypothetical protein
MTLAKTGNGFFRPIKFMSRTFITKIQVLVLADRSGLLAAAPPLVFRPK